MNAMTLILFFAGLALLIAGAEFLVRGASRLAASFGISPLVVGLTVVALGTSAPELAVCVSATWGGEPDVAVGNIIGSNILNILFVLGVAAAVIPLIVATQLVRWDVPLMIIASFVFWGLAADGSLGRIDGAILFGGIIAYILFAIRMGRRESAKVRARYEEEFGVAPAERNRPLLNLSFVVLGLAALVFGSAWLVEGAVAMARVLGISELIIGLTVVAMGTSAPEVVTSIVAGLRGERDIAVGNAVGSNLFNLLAVGGLSALVAPDAIPVSSVALRFDIPIMVTVAVACLPIFFVGYRIDRWKGFLFLGYYAAYTAYLIMEASKSPGLEAYGNAMLWFALPLTALTLVGLVVRAWRAESRSA